MKFFNYLKRWEKGFRREKHLEKTTNTGITPVEKSRQLTLIEFFVSQQLYWIFIQYLIDLGRISPVTHTWIDFKSGYKETLVTHLKQLHVLGYLKDNQHLTNQQILEISRNVFGVDVRIDTIKHTKHDTIMLPYLKPAPRE